MFRKARGIALCLGTLARPVGVATAAALCFGAVVTGCTDENDPKTWVSQLNDPAKQVQAVNRIVQKYEDSLTEDKKDREGAHVKPLLDVVMDPMTKLCTDGKMTDQTRSKVVKFIADTWDKRGIPCLKKTLEDYKPGTTEGDVQQVMRAVANTKMPELEDGVVKVFMALKATDAASRQDNMYLDVQAATNAVATKAHEDDFIKLLQRPMPDDPKKDPKGTTNEWYWQVNAAQILGNLHSEKAIKPLMAAMLTPAKFNSVIGNECVMALVKIGKPVVAPATALLNSSSDMADLIKLSTDENLKAAADIKDAKQLEAAKKAAEKAHVSIAAQILGQLGRADAAQPLIDALAKAPDEAAKAVIAYQLPSIPKTDETENAFKSTFEAMKIDTPGPSGNTAREDLLGVATNFYDASLVPWMLDQANKLKGEPTDVEAIKLKTLDRAMLLMKHDQVADVKTLYDQ
jgi:hypothetical protein